MGKRKIVKIDEDKCTGCGLCIPSCHEGALQIVDGKAKLVSEVYCDGLGACLGECPEGAISIEEREAEEFDEKAVEEHMEQTAEQEEPLPSGTSHVCPGSAVRRIREKTEADASGNGHVESELVHWPVQLTLLPAKAPYLKDADLLLTADCVPFAMGDFHQKLLRGNVVAVACPKLDNGEMHVDKLAEILRASGIKSLTVVHMEVPCCFGLQQIAAKAVEDSGSSVPVKDITIGIDGSVK